MPKIRRFIEISQIEMDKWPINNATLKLVWFLTNGGEVPPIKIQQLANGNFRIKDGRHRLTAYKLLGKTKIEAKFGDLFAHLWKPVEAGCKCGMRHVANRYAPKIERPQGPPPTPCPIAPKVGWGT